MDIKDIAGDEVLYKKIIRIAQYEAEMDMGVNPLDNEQAETAYLSERDFEYIKHITTLVETRLKDEVWLKNTLLEIENLTNIRPPSGIRFDDELFKVGRGILESFLQEKYRHDQQL